MPGIMLNTNGKIANLRNYDDSRCRRDIIEDNSVVIQRNTLNKFINDKVFAKKGNIVIAIEGIIYNYTQYKKIYNCDTCEEVLFNLYEEKGIDLLKDFRGEIAGFVLDKQKGKLYVFTSKLGSKAIFYYYNRECLVAGSQLNYITDYMKEHNLKRTVSNESIRQFLAYGYYLDDSTCVDGVRRVYPGHCLVYDLQTQELSDHVYYVADYKQSDTCDQSVAIKQLHDTFISAMKDIVEKNREYGYKTLLDASGGADSRMICCTARELGAEDVLMDCYAQSESNDVKNAQKLARLLDYDFVFKSLDNAKCLMNIDDFILMNNGATIYYGITGGKDMLEMIDQNKFGLECTGLLGNVYYGSMVVIKHEEGILEDYPKYRVSRVLEYGKDYTFPSKMHKYFNNHANEHYWFYTRGMIFGMTSYFIRQNFTEVATPFGDDDFLKEYLTIPWNERVNNHLLRKWMIKYYKDAANIKYSDNHFSITESITPKGDLIEILQKVFNRIRRKFPQKKAIGMNDYVFWYNNNTNFRNYVDKYYETNLPYCDAYEDVKNLVIKLYNNSIKDKLLAVSVISMIKQYIID